LEYESVLKRKPLLDLADIESVIDYLCIISEKHGIFYLWRPILQDPQDGHVLELAVKTQASIVAWNVKDFAPAKEKFGIEVITPRDLLIRLELS
jgi:predicted nucleic acid-binding protein